MKKLVGVIILFVVLLTGASVVVHMFVDQQALRRNVIAAVHQQTGMTLSLGRSNVQLLPWPSFDAGDLVLRDADDVPVLKARSVHAGIALFALLHREVRLQDFTVDGAQVTLRRTASGRANWTVVAPVRRGATTPVRAGGRVPTRWLISADALHLTQGSVCWNDAHAGLSGQFDIKLLDLAGLQSPSPWINLVASHHAVPFTLQGHIGALALIRSGAAPWTFSLGATLGTEAHRDWLNLDGAIRDARQLHGIDVTAQGEWQSLRDLQALFPHAGLPDVRDVGGVVNIEDDAGDVPVSWASLSQLEEKLVRGLKPVRVHMHAGTVDIPDRGVRLGNIHLDADAPDALLGVGSDLAVRNLAWRLQGHVGTLAQAVTLVRDRRGALLPVDLEIRSQPLSLASAFDMSGSAPPANAQDDAHLRLQGDLGTAGSHLKLTGSAQAMHLPGAVLHDVAVEMTGEMPSLRALRIPILSLQSRELSMTADLSGEQGGDNPPVLAGHVHVKGVDLDALQGIWQSAHTAETGSKTASDTLSSTVAGSRPPLATEGAGAVKPGSKVSPAAESRDTSSRLYRALHAVDLDLHFQMDRVHFHARDYTNIAAHVTLSGGHLGLVPFTGQDGQTHLSGSIDLDASGRPMRLAMTFQPMMLPTGVVEQLLGIPMLLDGPMELVGTVSGSGDTLPALQTSLAGHLGLSVVDGTVDGASLGALAGPAAASVLGSGARPLRCFGVHLTLANGSATVDTFGLQSGRFSTVGSGRLGLVGHEVTLHLVPVIDFAGAGASTPVLVTGVLPDFHASQERDAGGSFQLSLTGHEASDPCPGVLKAARETLDGPPAPAMQADHHSKAGDILRALGVLH